MFGGASAAAARPSLTTAPPWDDLTRLKEEFEAVGFYLSAHPLDSYKILLERLGVVPVTRVPKYLLGRESNRVKLAGIVLGKQERIAKSGNRFAFVQASDASGSFEMTIFADLLATARAHLETGTAVLFEADAQVSESETRYMGRSVEPLKVAAERLARGVSLVLRRESALPPLAKLMEQMPTGRAKLQLVVVLDDGAEAEIDIPGIWQLNETVKNQFRALPGGAEVQEF